jgi:centrosomal protein CEP290
LLESQVQIDERFKELIERESNNNLKIRYLRKTMLDLCNQYSSMTPIYLISDFIKHYIALLEARKQFDVKSIEMRAKSSPEVIPSQSQLKEISLTGDIEAKIEIIKHKSSCDYLKEQLKASEATIKELHNEIARIKANEIKNMQHWNTIRMLFGNDEINAKVEERLILKFDKEVQAEPSKNDCGTITDEISHQVPEPTKLSSSSTSPSTPIKTSEDPHSSSSEITVKAVAMDDNLDDQKSLQMQLKKALILASSRSSLLIETGKIFIRQKIKIQFL